MVNKRSKILIEGFFARYYTFLLNFITFGFYQKLVKSAINLMDLKSGDKIIDFGCGPGLNDILILKRINFNGKVVGLDISDDMLIQAKKREKKFKNFEVIKLRIDEDLPFKEEFDHVFISFVLHGFENYDKEKILRNANKVLRKGGYLNVLDYSEFNLERANFLIKIFFNKIECELAKEFIKLDFSKFVENFGFKVLNEYILGSGYIRLLVAEKLS
ncbi:MAG: class I SAM-dependent methyltransferase [Caldisericia bacterium]|jgi:demethylmenaquinone methyltransferase/2-methoxy-6-polyprenyl-1,4-benzoquinol methylase|nr:class I SAM-dependent methyltransferase [Caldisericia bacterium]